MLALITLLNGRSVHLDFGVDVEPADPSAARWGAPLDAQPQERYEALLATCNEPAGLAAVLDALQQQSQHDLPSLAPFDAWQADAIRSIVSGASARPRDGAADDLEQSGVTALLASDRWEVLAGLWLCAADDLSWAAYTPRNKDEIRVRARALLGIEGDAEGAVEGVPFLADQVISVPARRRLIEAMGRSSVAEAVPALIELLDHADLAMQQEAVIALGRIGVGAALAPLLDHWGARDGALRPSIRTALRGLSSLQGHAYLNGFVETGSPVMAAAAVFIDDRLELRRELPKDWLLTCLASAEPKARRDAALLLGAFGDESDAAPLRDLAASDADETLRALARGAADNLARCGRQKPVDFAKAAD